MQVAGARVCLAWWLVGWEGRGLVAARVLCLMLVCLTGWVVLLADAAAAADAGLLVVRREVAVLRRRDPRPGPSGRHRICGPIRGSAAGSGSRPGTGPGRSPGASGAALPGAGIAAGT